MNIETIFDFIKEKRGYNIPFVYKLIKGLPLTEDDLNVEGNLDLYMIDIPSLPDNLTVGGTLDLRRTNIKYLPNNLTVKDTLILSNNPYIKNFPNNLQVMGNLYLFNTNFSFYSDGRIRQMIEDKGGHVEGIIRK